MATFNSDAVKSEFNQYWYSQLTIETLLSEITHHATRCAFLSTPSLYFALGAGKSQEAEEAEDVVAQAEHRRAATLRRNSKLFEFDRQWASDPGFVFYDLQKPEQIPVQYIGYFDYVVVDPPFITKEVWAKYVETIKLLIKRPDPTGSGGDQDAPPSVGAGAIRDCLGGGKVLFTTVLENHTMLEGLINGPLFIPRFRPYVCNLVYQYVCFLNYDATRLQRANPEVPEDDPESQKLWAAITMANDIRHSETAFALQMEQRDRDGEAPLPTLAHEHDVALGIVDANGDLVQAGATAGAAGQGERQLRDLTNVPISEMRWSYVPEGLTMYPANGSAPGAGAEAAQGEADEEDPAALGPVYSAALTLRAQLDDFKGRIDQTQKLLDKQMKLRHQRVKLTKEKQQQLQQQQEEGRTEGASAGADLEAALAQVTRDIESSEADRTAHLDAMAALAAAIVDKERQLADLKAREQQSAEGECVNGEGQAGGSPAIAYESAMTACVAAYRAVEVKKIPLQELAADATRKFKSPVFSRMKELLQEMKDIKKAHRATMEAQRNEDGTGPSDEKPSP